MIDYEAMAVALEAAPWPYRPTAMKAVLAAALGDDPLYRRTSGDEHGELDAAIAFGEAVQIWPDEER